jgi:hypothetical protein
MDKMQSLILAVTLKQWIMVAAGGIVLRLLWNRKRIMACVRSQLLTLEGFVSGAVHAAMLIGLMKFWESL